MRKEKKSGLSKYFDIFGSILLAVVLVIVAWNFVKDGRAFVKPALSAAAAAGKQDAKSGSDGYKTLKYSKPSSDGKSGSSGNTGKSTGSKTGKSASGSGGKAGTTKNSTGGSQDHSGSNPAVNP